MALQREKMAFMPRLFPLVRWCSGYFRRTAHPANATVFSDNKGHGALFFGVSLLLHSVAIFLFAAAPAPKKPSAIEVILLGPPASVACMQIAASEGREKTAQSSKRKFQGSVVSVRKKKVSAQATSTEPAPTSSAQSLAQPLPSDSMPVAAMGHSGQSGSAASSDFAAAAGGSEMGMAGTAKPGGGEHGLSQYLRLVRERIWSCKKYPFIARKRALEGEVGVRFLLTGAGEAQRLVVSRSSGQDILDRAALKAVEDGAPFPLPPAGLLAEPITIELNVIFNLS